MGTFLTEKIDAVVDGETQEIWPKTAAWFLGPKVFLVVFSFLRKIIFFPPGGKFRAAERSDQHRPGGAL